jgi:hypothetical protein
MRPFMRPSSPATHTDIDQRTQLLWQSLPIVAVARRGDFPSRAAGKSLQFALRYVRAALRRWRQQC